MEDLFRQWAQKGDSAGFIDFYRSDDASDWHVELYDGHATMTVDDLRTMRDFINQRIADLEA